MTWKLTGGAADLIVHCSRNGTNKTAVREYKVSEPTSDAHYPALVTIHFVDPRMRRRRVLGMQVTSAGAPHYYTIERAGRVIYDSRTDVPCDMAEFAKSAAKHQELRRLGAIREAEWRAELARNPPPPPKPRPLPTETWLAGCLTKLGQCRCCMCKVYPSSKQAVTLTCHRCDREYDRTSGHQVEDGWRWKAAPGGRFYFMGDGKPLPLKPMPIDVEADQGALL